MPGNTHYNNLCQRGRMKGEDFPTRLRRTVKGRVVDGLIALVFSQHQESFQSRTLPLLQEGNIPIVVLQLNSAEYACPSVGYDIEAAGYQSAEHLLDQGYRDIACVAKDNPFGIDYYNGYCRALHETGITINERLRVESSNSVVGGAELAEIELKKDSLHEAYMIGRDSVALGFIRELKKIGKKVPKDVAVMGCDRMIDENEQIPFLTTVDRKFDDHGYRAADMLFGLLDNNNKSLSTRDILNPELVIHNTCIKNK